MKGARSGEMLCLGVCRGQEGVVKQMGSEKKHL